jgi:SAM-dependent methyltransferase
MLPMYAALVEAEYRMWERLYAPISLRGKVVLDVGAGCGETAIFYLSQGAKSVIAVEPDRLAYECLARNCSRYNLPVVLIDSEFNLKLLELEYDFMKLDAEGAEVGLLSYKGRLKPSVIEIHDTLYPGLCSRLTKEFRFEAVTEVHKDIFLASSRRESGRLGLSLVPPL